MAPGIIEPDLIGQPAVANLNTSGDSDSCEFADWHVHTQVINGMYKRVFVYDASPVPATAGVVSGAPAISYSYVDCNYTVQVAEELEKASYCSGNYQSQGLTFMSDSTDGGLGLSGTFTTSAIGYARRTWVVGSDSESTCSQSSNCSLAKVPGNYDSTYDTSATMGSHIAQLLMHCEQACPTFNQNLVTY